MQSPITLEIAKAARKTIRNRRPLLPLEARDWMSANETALMLGSSVATVHRLRRGVIPGIELLPCCQYGRKYVFRKLPTGRRTRSKEDYGNATVARGSGFVCSATIRTPG
jgi:hypothetical protein